MSSPETPLVPVVDVIVAGNACVDLVCGPLDDLPGKDRSVRVDSLERDIGGCGANTARSLARLETPVALVACLGDDADGHLIEEGLVQAGVQVDRMVRCSSRASGLTVCLSGSAGSWRSFIYRPGANLDLSPELVRERLPAKFRVLHLAGFWGVPLMTGDRVLGLLREARARGATISIDTSWSSARNWQVDAAVLAETDIIFPNQDEARAISGHVDLRMAAGWFHSRGVDVVVITRGPEGAFVSTPSGAFDVAPPRIEALDAIGAGDACAAGFVAEIVRLGLDTRDQERLRAQARLACAAGALAVSGPGGCGLLESRAAAAAMMPPDVRLPEDPAL